MLPTGFLGTMDSSGSRISVGRICLCLLTGVGLILWTAGRGGCRIIAIAGLREFLEFFLSLLLLLLGCGLCVRVCLVMMSESARGM